MIVTEDTTIGELRGELQKRGVRVTSIRYSAGQWIVHLDATGDFDPKRTIAFTGSISLAMAISEALSQLDEDDSNAETVR